MRPGTVFPSAQAEPPFKDLEAAGPADRKQQPAEPTTAGWDSRYKDDISALLADRGESHAAAEAHTCDDTSEGKNSSSTTMFYLRDMLQDAYEYHGVSNLGIFICSFVLAAVCVYMHWDERYAMFRVEVQQSIASFTDPTSPVNSTMTLSTDAEGLYDVLQYMQLYTRMVLETSEEHGHPYNDIHLLDYTKVRSIRFLVNIDTACNPMFNRVLNCYLDDATRDRSLNRTPAALSSVWLPIPIGITPTYVYSMKRRQMYQVTILSADGKEEGGATYQGALERLSSLASDTVFLSKYAMDVHLEIVAQTQLDKGGENSMFGMFWLRASRQTNIWDTSSAGGAPLDNKVNVFSSSLLLRSKMWEGPRDYLIHALTAALLITNMFYLLRECYELRLCYYQSKFHDVNYTWLKATVHYLRNPWNTIDVISSLLSLFWSVTWFALLVMHKRLGVQRFEPTYEYTETYAVGLQYGMIYNTFVFVGILNILFWAVRVYQYMQVHAGLRVYYNLFSQAFHSLKDFMFWFLFVLFTVSFITAALFQFVSGGGGNPDFVTRLGGLEATARLTFNFYDNASYTSGENGSAVVFLFWLTVVLLIIFAQNIVLAIIADAYMMAKTEEGPVEATMLRIVFTRMFWYAWYTWKVLLCDWRLGIPGVGGIPLSEAMDGWSDYIVTKYCDGKGGHKTDLHKRLLVRWAIALIPEVQTLLAYYSDAGSLKVYSAPVWANPEVIKKHKLLMQYRNRRQWSTKDEYPSYVDMLMLGSHGITKYLESCLDSRELEMQNLQASAALNQFEHKRFCAMHGINGTGADNYDNSMGMTPQQCRSAMYASYEDTLTSAVTNVPKVKAMSELRGIFGGAFFYWRDEHVRRVASLMLLVYGTQIGEDDFMEHPVCRAPRAEGVPMAAMSVKVPQMAGAFNYGLPGLLPITQHDKHDVSGATTLGGFPPAGPATLPRPSIWRSRATSVTFAQGLGGGGAKGGDANGTDRATMGHMLHDARLANIEAMLVQLMATNADGGGGASIDDRVDRASGVGPTFAAPPSSAVPSNSAEGLNKAAAAMPTRSSASLHQLPPTSSAGWVAGGSLGILGTTPHAI